MPIVPNPSILRNLAYYIGLGKFFVIFWFVCQVFGYVASFVVLFLAIKYSAYIPSSRGEKPIKMTPYVEEPKQVETKR